MTETEETYLGQVWGSYPEGTAERWLDYARGRRAESRRWFEQRDPGTARVVDWITREVIWPLPEREPVTEEQWMQTQEYLYSGDWPAGDINERRPVIVMWNDPTETPSECVERLNTEVVETAKREAKAAQRVTELRGYLEATVALFTEDERKPIIDDAAGVDQDHVKFYASPEWYQRYTTLLHNMRTELKK